MPSKRVSMPLTHEVTVTFIVKSELVTRLPPLVVDPSSATPSWVDLLPGTAFYLRSNCASQIRFRNHPRSSPTTLWATQATLNSVLWPYE